jgi:hypothetical protein
LALQYLFLRIVKRGVIVDKEGLHLQARRGYFAPKPTKAKK